MYGVKHVIRYKDKHLTIFESQIYQTVSTVIQTDDCVIVADPAFLPMEIGEIQQYVQSVKGNRPIYLLFTHSDWDHIVGAGAFPEATVIASEAFTAKNPDEILEQGKAFDDEYYLDRKYPLIYPEVDVAVEKDGQQLRMGQTVLTFYEAKGHTDDGIFAIVEPLGIWIAGDYLSDIEFPFIYSSVEDYIETLKKTDMILDNHEIHVMIPGHGHAAFGKNEILKRKSDGLRYIQNLIRAVESNAGHEHLVEPYPYKRSLIKCHEANVKFIKSARQP